MAGLNFFEEKDPEWRDMEVAVAGASLTKILDIRVGVDVEQEHLMGEGDDPYSIQTGNRKPGGLLKVHKSAFDVMMRAAIAGGGRDVTDLEFDIVILFKAQGVRPIQINTVVGCKISKYELGWTQGAKQMELELPFLFLRHIFA